MNLFSRDHVIPPVISRRDMLTRCGMGFGMVGLAGIFADEGVLRGQETIGNADPLAPKFPHFQGKAKACCPPLHEWRAVTGRYV